MHTPWLFHSFWLPLLSVHHRDAYSETRFEKGTRYYVLRLSKDLLDDWVITLINGRMKSRLGQSRTLAFTSFMEGFEHFCSLASVRHKRGYQLKTFACDNPMLRQLMPYMIHVPPKKEVPKVKIIKSTEYVPRLRKSSPSLSSHQLGFAF